jgi:hypothetical protein
MLCWDMPWSLQNSKRKGYPTVGQHSLIWWYLHRQFNSQEGEKSIFWTMLVETVFLAQSGFSKVRKMAEEW